MWLFIVIFISFTFWFAALSKILSVGSFAKLLIHLQVPGAKSYPYLLAISIILLEMLVAGLTLIGGVYTLFGLISATVLMVLFIWVISRLLGQEARQACNCFGRSERPVNRLDLVRNIGLCLCSTTGVCISQTAVQIPANKMEIGLIGALGFAIAIFWVHLGELYELLKL